jgi:RNA polymerase II subunit A small phosphatase-like protein
MSITQQGPHAGPVGNTNPTASDIATSKQPKKKGIFSFLCCGIPDSTNTSDPNDAAAPPNKVTKIPLERPTTASKPEQAPIKQLNNMPPPPQNEKQPLRQDEPAQDSEKATSLDSGGSPQSGATLHPQNGDVNRLSGDARDQPLPELPKEAESSSASQVGRSNPSVVVQAPARTASTKASSRVPSQVPKDSEGDVKMEDSESVANEQAEAPVPAAERGEPVNKPTMPPPPPVPQPVPSEQVVAPEPAEQKQQWLLPPITPRFQGKKCLVLDLDETLVHSSFKVCLP